MLRVTVDCVVVGILLKFCSKQARPICVAYYCTLCCRRYSSQIMFQARPVAYATCALCQMFLPGLFGSLSLVLGQSGPRWPLRTSNKAMRRVYLWGRSSPALTDLRSFSCHFKPPDYSFDVLCCLILHTYFSGTYSSQLLFQKRTFMYMACVVSQMFLPELFGSLCGIFGQSRPLQPLRTSNKVMRRLCEGGNARSTHFLFVCSRSLYIISNTVLWGRRRNYTLWHTQSCLS